MPYLVFCRPHFQNLNLKKIISWGNCWPVCHWVVGNHFPRWPTPQTASSSRTPPSESPVEVFLWLKNWCHKPFLSHFEYLQIFSTPDTLSLLFKCSLFVKLWSLFHQSHPTIYTNIYNRSNLVDEKKKKKAINKTWFGSGSLLCCFFAIYWLTLFLLSLFLAVCL